MNPGQLNVTQARRLLPGLLHEIELHPDRVFRIVSRRRLIAELRAPPRVARLGLAAERLLALAGARPRAAGRRIRVSEDSDSHVYGG